MRLSTICGYKGSKRKFAPQIVSRILALNPTRVFDVCCGSGAVSLELVNQGFDPEKICMVDAGPWGDVWKAIGDGTLNLDLVRNLLTRDIPDDPRAVSDWVEKKIATRAPSPETFIVLQAASFGSTPVWWDGARWRRGEMSANRGYKARPFWEPSPTSKEKKPRGTIFTPHKVVSRTVAIAEAMRGVEAHCCRAEDLAYDEGVVYIDPPYANSTGYGVEIDWRKIVASTNIPVLVSEGERVQGASESWELTRKRKGASLTGRSDKTGANEWLNGFRVTTAVDLPMPSWFHDPQDQEI